MSVKMLIDIDYYYSYNSVVKKTEYKNRGIIYEGIHAEAVLCNEELFRFAAR